MELQIGMKKTEIMILSLSAILALNLPYYIYCVIPLLLFYFISEIIVAHFERKHEKNFSSSLNLAMYTIILAIAMLVVGLLLSQNDKITNAIINFTFIPISLSFITILIHKLNNLKNVLPSKQSENLIEKNRIVNLHTDLIAKNIIGYFKKVAKKIYDKGQTLNLSDYEILKKFDSDYNYFKIQELDKLAHYLANINYTINEEDIEKIIDVEIENVRTDVFRDNIFLPKTKPDISIYVDRLLFYYSKTYHSLLDKFVILISEHGLIYTVDEILDLIYEKKKKLEIRNYEDYIEKDFTEYEIDYMSGIEFEHYLKQYFTKLGFYAEVTKATGDYGADLILEKHGVISVVQAKRSQSKINNKAIQEIVAAKKYYNATHGIVVTNNYFTDNAINLAKHNNIELIDRDTLFN